VVVVGRDVAVAVSVSGGWWWGCGTYLRRSSTLLVTTLLVTPLLVILLLLLLRLLVVVVVAWRWCPSWASVDVVACWWWWWPWERQRGFCGCETPKEGRLGYLIAKV
jgi:hypothetical protein